MSDIEQQTNRREDYDSHADKLWSVYNREAESYDRALMETWKDDMDSIIIFAGLFSAVLTAFLIDASKKLKEDPADRTNALLSQTVVLLAQISQQLGPNGSQAITSPLEPLPQFELDSSDLRVNIFWFMSLAFSITAALGATLVQQWVRDYLQIFQRYSGSLERSRMRQFLFHGLASNYMHLLVECIPAFIHISLFLFFIGLADNLFITNSAVAITTTAIMGFCTLFYIMCSVFPALYIKTPYHTPLSTLFWKMGQIVRPRKYSDKNTHGKPTPVSSDMGKGRFQLAMGHSDDRAARDTEAICWMLTKLTEDSEFEPFFASIGGSLATSWGKDIWRSIFKESPRNLDLTSKHSSTVTLVANAMQAFKIRIESLLYSCGVPTSPDQQSRFGRACVCINAVASLTLGFEDGLELDIDSDIMIEVLRYFGDEKKRRDKLAQESKTSSNSAMNLHQLPSLHMDISLEIKWKCLVLLEIKKALRDSSWMAYAVKMQERSVSLKDFRTIGDEDEAMSRKDLALWKAWNAAQQLHSELSKIPQEHLTEVRLKTRAPRWRNHIAIMQESLDALNPHMRPSIDSSASCSNNHLFQTTGAALQHFGNVFEWRPPLKATSEEIDWEMPPDPFWLMPHPSLLPPHLLICHLLVCADPRRRPNFNLLTSQVDLVGLGTLLNNLPKSQKAPDRDDSEKECGLEEEPQGPRTIVSQIWRFKDIQEHEGVGLMIEMFFATFRTLEEELVTFESARMIKATLMAIIDNNNNDNRRSKHLKAAGRRFLWAMRRELEEEATRSSIFVVKMLLDLFGKD